MDIIEVSARKDFYAVARYDCCGARYATFQAKEAAIAFGRKEAARLGDRFVDRSQTAEEAETEARTRSPESYRGSL